MAIRFNADEVFEIGVEIEKNGKAFYEAAAASAQNEDARQLLEELAAWEAGHIALFRELKDKLADATKEETAFDPDSQSHLYLKAAADSHVFNSSSDPVKIAQDCAGIADVLNRALAFEKDSVVVYTSMKGLVPGKLGKDDIDRLVNEELDHIRILSEKIAELA